MAIERIFICDCCGGALREPYFGSGAKDWMQIQGVKLNGVDNPYFCPACKTKIMDMVDAIVDAEAG